MDSQEQQLIDRIKQAQNLLVTVSSNPSVDQLAAAIGLTIALNKLDKHGTAVFSGKIPNTIEFLKPEDTLERTTDSLRDFIIALDKSKADKLRYKVEDQVVRIFITPYRTSLSEKDLQFSQGDFNVDVVIALGVVEQKELDTAITAHGRILHDATVTTVSAGGKSELGTINWMDEHASSLSEMMLGLIDGLGKTLLDGQIATALLTGIVATTDRFRNERTTPKAMNASAELMAAGANQQLIASELDSSPLPAAPSQGHIHDENAAPSAAPAGKTDPGILDIDHQAAQENTQPRPEEYRAPAPEADLAAEKPKESEPQIHVDANGQLSPAMAMPMPMGPFGPMPTISQVHVVEPDEAAASGGVHRDRIVTPPSMGGSLTAAHTDDTYDPTTEALTLPPVSAAPMLSHNETVLPAAALPSRPLDESPFIPQAPLPGMAPPSSSPPPAPPMMSPSPLPLPSAPITPVSPFSPAGQVTSASPTPLPALPSAVPPDSKTLADLEQAVRSPHLGDPAPTASPAAMPLSPANANGVDNARNAVQAAFGGASDQAPHPIAALNALPLGPDLHPMPAPPPSAGAGPQPAPGTLSPAPAFDMPLPSNPFGPGQQSGPPPLPGTAPQGAGSDVPSVPPPFVPPMPQ